MKQTVCDICGKFIGNYTHQYQIKKRIYEKDTCWNRNRLDICEDCWREMVLWIRRKKEDAG